MVRRLVITLFMLLLAAPIAIPQSGGSMAEIYRLFNTGKHDACIKSCETLLTREPKNAAAHHILGRCLLGTPRIDGAIRHLERCLALTTRPNWMTAWSHTALGEAYLRKGDPARARKHLEKAIALDATANATHEARKLLARITGKTPSPPGQPTERTAERLPEFIFAIPSGPAFRRADLGARPVILKFGTSW